MQKELYISWFRLPLFVCNERIQILSSVTSQETTTLQGLEGGPAGTLFRGPRLKKHMSDCYQQIRNNVAKLIPAIKMVWPKGFGKIV